MNNNNQYFQKKLNKNKNVVLVGGCFDLLHFGHIAFLKEAKKMVDYLLVLLESDENVKRLKGEGRPFHTQTQRKEMLESLSFVDEVRNLPPMEGDEAYYNLIKEIRPSVIAFTQGDPLLEHKMKQAKEVGAKAVVIPKIHTPSTSQLAKLLNLE
jgi:rfaE bifunctional protein nucleotidyltransferase chain/domain